MAGGSLIRCDARDFERLLPRAADWDETLRGELRTELGSAGRAAAGRAARNVMHSEFPPTDPPRRVWPDGSTGLRVRLARSLNVTVRDGNGAVECRISTNHRLAPHTNGSVHWRHPVFGNREVWRGQEGSGWWSNAMATSRPAMAQAVRRALAQAVHRF